MCHLALMFHCAHSCKAANASQYSSLLSSLWEKGQNALAAWTLLPLQTLPASSPEATASSDHTFNHMARPLPLTLTTSGALQDQQKSTGTRSTWCKGCTDQHAAEGGRTLNHSQALFPQSQASVLMLMVINWGGAKRAGFHGDIDGAVLGETVRAGKSACVLI